MTATPENAPAAGEARTPGQATADALVRAVREAWDKEFYGTPETSVDVRQAQVAVDVVLAAAELTWDEDLRRERDHARAQLAIATTALRNIALGIARDPSVAADRALVAIRDQEPGAARPEATDGES